MTDPNMSESPTAEFTPGKGPIFNRVANYFTGQPYGNLLSTIMICGFGYWFWWSQTVGENQKAKQIQDGMASVMKSGQEAAAALTTQHIEANKNLAEQNSGAVKAVAEQNAEVFKAAMEHAEKAAVRREADLQFLRDLVTGKKHAEKVGEADPPFDLRGEQFAAPKPEPGPPGT